MDPLTHALTSYALVRTALPRPAKGTILLVVVAGVAPDLDTLSEFGGASWELRWGGAATHSLLGATALAVLLAIGFRGWQRKGRGGGGAFLPALGLALLGVAAHVLLDLTTSRGVALLWPLRGGRTAWNFTLLLDPLLLTVLLLTLLLPGLFRLISDEIGARTEGRTARGWAMAALAFLALFCAARFFLHERAETLLGAGRYHERGPLHAGAFPDSANPFHWLGVVETEASIEELQVSAGPGADFNPDRSRSYFKPEASAALDAAREAPGAAQLLGVASFPSASVEHTADGFRVEFRDIGFSCARNMRGYYFAEVELDGQARVVREQIGYTREHLR